MARVGFGRGAGVVGLAVAISMASGAWWASRPRDPLATASAAYARGDWAESGARARERVLAHPEDDAASRLLARASSRMGHDSTARAIYRRLGTGVMEAEDLFLLGRGLLHVGQAAPAVHALGAALDIEPGHPETLDALSRHWAATGSRHEAAGLAGRLAKVPGWEVRGLARMGPLLRELRDPVAAAGALASALGRDPGLAGSGLEPEEARKLLASCWLEAGRPAEAVRALEALGRTGSEADPEVAWLRSRAALQEGRAAEAASLSALAARMREEQPDPMKLEPAPFVGEARCSACHAAIARSKGESRHSRTIVKTGELSAIPWPEGPITDADDPAVVHEFVRSGGRLEVKTRVQSKEYRAFIEFALGSNHQGQSFVAIETGGRAREVRISRYPSEPAWARTIEHPSRPLDPPGYLGRPISEASRLLCLDCHATHFRAAQASPSDRPEAADRGIGCERCHGPGGHHVLAVDLRFPEPAIARPRLAPAGRVMALCGECHKAPGSIAPDDPRSIRFQTPAIERSRCYAEGRSGMTCVTCHNPHQDAERSPAYYEAKCLACHSKADRHRSTTSPACKVNTKSDCLNCHMPRVTDAVPRSTFTDHFIRIRRDPRNEP